jgi:3-keto-5-aminohexanoate cleavage enzyme
MTMLGRPGDPVILTCAVIGGLPSENPNHPRTLDDIIDQGVGAVRAGAAILHIHAYTRDGQATQAADVYEAIAAGIRDQIDDVMMNFTTGGAPGMTEDERLQSLDAHPEVASFDAGSLNFGPRLFENNPSFLERMAREMRQRGVKPEIECFDSGMVLTGTRLMREGLIAAPALFQFVLGVPGGAPARVDTLCHLVSLLPADARWAATAVGAPHFALMAATVALGGHIRTGMEDVARTGPGAWVTSNADLVERARDLCTAAGRPIVTAQQARELLAAEPGAQAGDIVVEAPAGART